METVIVLTDLDLIDRVKTICHNNPIINRLEVLEDGDVYIVSNNRSVIRLSITEPDEIYDQSLVFKHQESGGNFYALYYYDIELIKFIITRIEYDNLLINNDFEDINYTYRQFVEKIIACPDWDWRTDSKTDLK